MKEEAEMSEATAWFIVINAVLLFVLGPFITIWAVNTLFPAAAIPFNFLTWLAAMWLHLTVFKQVR